MLSFSTGDRVRLKGLSTTHLNGHEGVVVWPQQYDGQVSVQVVFEEEDKLLKVNAENITVCDGADQGKMWVTKLTEQRETYQVEIHYPQSWFGVAVFPETNETDSSDEPSILLRAMACGRPQCPLVMALPAPVRLSKCKPVANADKCQITLRLYKIMSGVVDLDNMPRYTSGETKFLCHSGANLPFNTLCGLVNEMMEYQSKNQKMQHFLRGDENNIGVTVLPVRLLGDNREPVLEVMYWASLISPYHEAPLYVVQKLVSQPHPVNDREKWESQGVLKQATLNACATSNAEAVLLLIEMLEINSLRIRGSQGRQRHDNLGFVRSFLPRMQSLDEAYWEYSLQPYRERESVGAGLTTQRLQFVHEYRRRRGLVPQARGVDWSAVCACCGQDVSDRLHWWCLCCRRLVCCGERCRKTLKEIHQPWCGVRQVDAVGHGAQLPTSLAISLVNVAERLAVPANKIRSTKRSLNTLVKRLSVAASENDARFRRIAVGGSLAKGTAIRLGHDVDVVLFYDFNHEAADSPEVFCDAHATVLEVVESLLGELGAEVVGRELCGWCILARWEGHAMDVFVGFDCVGETQVAHYRKGEEGEQGRGISPLSSAIEEKKKTSSSSSLITPSSKIKDPDTLAITQWKAAFTQVQRFGRGRSKDNTNSSQPPMRVSSPQKRMSPSFTESSVMFLANQPLAVLRAIRVAKLWKRCLIAEDAISKFQGGDGSKPSSVEAFVRNPSPDVRSHLSSYALELLVVHVYRSMTGNREQYPVDRQQLDPENTDVLFRYVLFFISRLDPLGCGSTSNPSSSGSSSFNTTRSPCSSSVCVVEFTDFYDPKAFPLPPAGGRNPLSIRDPVDPTRDVVRFFRKWDALVRVARKTLCALALATDPVRHLFLGDTFSWMHVESSRSTGHVGDGDSNEEEGSGDEKKGDVFSDHGDLNPNPKRNIVKNACVSSECFPDVGKVGRPSEHEKEMIGLQRQRQKLQREIKMMLAKFPNIYAGVIDSHQKRLKALETLISFVP